MEKNNREFTMKAMVIESFGGEETMRMGEIPTPEPAPDEVQIRVRYAGVNPVDWKIREGYLNDRLPHHFPIVLGWDAAGEVSAVGKEVKDFKAGDNVYTYCRKPIIKLGTFAEYVCVEASHVALKPTTINFAEAASVPLAALTAWQALFDFAQLKEGQTVLIHAGAGGVGSFAIQFAHLVNAKVITTASTRNHGYVKKLGADSIIDYTKEDFVAKVKELYPEGVDLVFDCVGGDTLKKSLDCVCRGGTLVSICSYIDAHYGANQDVKTGYVFVEPNGKQLQNFAKLIEEGKLLAPNVKEFPLSDAAGVLEISKQGHTQGKLVLKVK